MYVFPHTENSPHRFLIVFLLFLSFPFATFFIINIFLPWGPSSSPYYTQFYAQIPVPPPPPPPPSPFHHILAGRVTWLRKNVHSYMLYTRYPHRHNHHHQCREKPRKNSRRKKYGNIRSIFIAAILYSSHHSSSSHFHFRLLETEFIIFIRRF